MKLTDRASVKRVIESMTLEEKLRALVGATFFKTPGMPEYGIPSVYMLDGGTGMNYLQASMEAFTQAVLSDSESGEFGLGKAMSIMAETMPLMKDPDALANATQEQKKLVEKVKEKLAELIPGGVLPGCFPPGIVLASTWDPENVYNCGAAVAKEVQYYGIDVLLGTPNVNIHRDPLNGRLFEGYSEDPCLVSKLAPEFVKGVQDQGIIANVKHFAANNQETNRRGIDEKIQERALREIYLPGFKACVDAGCKTVMSAYNSINGTPCAHNHWLLTEVLKEEWGFEGFVVSDWGAVYDFVDALNGGNDYAMPAGTDIKPALDAVKEGRLKESVIDAALERYLNVILDAPVMKGLRAHSIDREFSRKAAYESIKEGLILLKNKDNVLPLSKETNVCFWGQYSKIFMESGGGSANVVTDQSTSMYGIMVEKLGADRVTFEEIRPETDVVVVTVCAKGSEGIDRTRMDLEPEDKAMLLDVAAKAKAAGKKIVVVLNVCGPVDMREYIDDVDAVLCIFYPGQEGGRAMAEALLGEINPSGKLPLTFPKRYEDVPSSTNFPGRNMEVWYAEGIFVGYRWYDYRNIEPLFPFGYGLSYTTFEILDAKLSRDVLNYENGDTVELSVTIKNTGKLAGKEVVQIYIGQENPTLVKPPKELKDFMKVELQPGQSKTVTFTLDGLMLRSYDEEIGGWIVEPGMYSVFVGNSSRNISRTLSFRVEGRNPFGFGENTPISDVASVPGALEKLMSLCPEGTISREEVMTQLLFQRTETISVFWRTRVEGKLPPEERQARYEKMLNEMNKFTPVASNFLDALS